MRVSGGKSEGSQCGNVLLLLYDLERVLGWKIRGISMQKYEDRTAETRHELDKDQGIQDEYLLTK